MLNLIVPPYDKDDLEDISIHLAGHYIEAKNHEITRLDNTCEKEAIFIYCYMGEGWFEYDGLKEVVKPGMAILCDKLTPHSYGSNPDKPWSIFWTHFTGSLSSDIVQGLEASGRVRLIDVSDKSTMYLLMSKIIAALTPPVSDMKRTVANSYLKALLCEIIVGGDYSKGELKIKAIPLEFCLGYMNQHKYETISLDQMSHDLGISKYYFSREFKKVTGFSPMAYFMQIKVKHACKLLIENETLSIAAISEELDFTTPYYFSEVFKKVTGCSPRLYRKLLGQNY